MLTDRDITPMSMSAFTEGNMGIPIIQGQFGSSEDKDSHDVKAAVSKKGKRSLL